MVISLIILSLIIAIDQITKFILFGMPNKSILGNFLWFQSEKNTGAAFSMFSGNNLVLIIITILACCFLIYFLFSKNYFNLKIEKIALALIIGGAVSNLIDRILFSYVRDFIYLKFINFAIFNIADMAITIGAILMIISVLFLQKREIRDDRVEFRN